MFIHSRKFSSHLLQRGNKRGLISHRSSNGKNQLSFSKHWGKEHLKSYGSWSQSCNLLAQIRHSSVLSNCDASEEDVKGRNTSGSSVGASEEGSDPDSRDFNELYKNIFGLQVMNSERLSQERNKYIALKQKKLQTEKIEIPRALKDERVPPGGLKSGISDGIVTQSVLDIPGNDFSEPFNLVPLPDMNTVTPIVHIKNESDVKVTTLDNNLRIASVENHNKIGVIAVVVECGPRFETPEEQGLSVLLNRLNFRQSKNYSREKLAELYGSISFESSVELESLVYMSEFYRQRLPEVTEILADLILQPIFDKEDIQETIMTLQMAKEEQLKNPTDPAVLSDLFLRSCFGERDLGKPALFLRENATEEELYGFMKRFIRPERCVIVGIGVNHDEFVSLVKKHFKYEKLLGENYQTGKNTYERGRNKSEKPVWIGGDHRIQHVEPPSHYLRQNIPALTSLMVGFEGFSIYDDHVFPVFVLEALLGGGDSFSAGGPGKGLLSIINSRYLGRYGFYNMMAQHQAFSDTGIFFIHASVFHERAGDLIKGIYELCNNMLKNVTEEDVQRAKARLKSAILLNMENVLQIPVQIGLEIMYENKFRGMDYFCEQIDKVTLKDLYPVVQRIISSRPSVTAIGNAQKIPPKHEIDERMASFIKQ